MVEVKMNRKGYVAPTVSRLYIPVSLDLLVALSADIGFDEWKEDSFDDDLNPLSPY